MTKSIAKPKAKRTSPAKQASKPSVKTAKSTKKTDTKTDQLPRPIAQAKSRAGLNAGQAHSTGTASQLEASRLAASQLIDQRIRDLGNWRGPTLARMRALILKSDPEMIEECKWKGTPVWSHHGIVCTGESYAKVVKLTFARGASVPDPSRLFNSSLDGGTRRAIDIHEGEQVDAAAFMSLVKAAVAHNSLRASKSKPIASKPAGSSSKAKPSPTKAKPAKLLSGGNPQIAKADGDAPVQAYIAAMPGWKRERGQLLDRLIARNVPGVCKAVKWNSPFYGVDGQGWFLGVHTFTNYVKVTFFRGTSLRPLPPGGTDRSKDARWVDLRKDDTFDEQQLAAWIKQAAALPGWTP